VPGFRRSWADDWSGFQPQRLASPRSRADPMENPNRVLRSLQHPGGDRCVDFFMRPDASFGFEVYRRDVEDARGWFPIGHQAQAVYATEAQALRAALKQVRWLRALIHETLHRAGERVR